MGNLGTKMNCCIQNDLGLDELRTALAKYAGVQPHENTYFGECYLLQNQDGSRTQLLVKQNVPLSKTEERMDLLLQLKKVTDGPAGQSVVMACPIATNQTTRCLRQTTDIFTIHDRILTDMHKVLDERIIANEEFTENQLKAIIKACTKGFIRLQFSQYCGLRLEHIYFCGEGREIKVAHPSLFNHPTNLELVEADYSSAHSKHIYLSPQELIALQKFQHHLVVSQTSNAFSFGMVLLSLMSLKHLDYLYSYQSCEIKWDDLNQVIKQCNANYPFHLISIIQDLLKQKESSRIGFKDLFNRLQTNETANKYTEDLVVNILGMGLSKGLIEEEPKEQALLQEQTNQNNRNKSRAFELERDFKVKYPNYLAAYLKPNISMGGQYVRVKEDQTPFQKFVAESVTANQRLRYTGEEANSLGSYVGQTMTLDGNLRKEPLREGKGLYQHSDGQSYIGDWHLGKMHGFGKLYFANKKLRYEGEFKDGLFHGNGTEYSQLQVREREEDIDQDYIKIFRGNWIKYEGHYVEDKRSGPGRIYFRKGHWRGNFKDGQPNGEGIFHNYHTQKETRGKWYEGQLLRL